MKTTIHINKELFHLVSKQKKEREDFFVIGQNIYFNELNRKSFYKNLVLNFVKYFLFSSIVWGYFGFFLYFYFNLRNEGLLSQQNQIVFYSINFASSLLTFIIPIYGSVKLRIDNIYFCDMVNFQEKFNFDRFKKLLKLVSFFNKGVEFFYLFAWSKNNSECENINVNDKYVNFIDDVFFRNKKIKWVPTNLSSTQLSKNKLFSNRSPRTLMIPFYFLFVLQLISFWSITFIPFFYSLFNI